MKALRNAAARFEFQKWRAAAQNLTSTRTTHSSEPVAEGMASDCVWDASGGVPVFEADRGPGA